MLGKYVRPLSSGGTGTCSSSRQTPYWRNPLVMPGVSGINSYASFCHPARLRLTPNAVDATLGGTPLFIDQSRSYFSILVSATLDQETCSPSPCLSSQLAIAQHTSNTHFTLSLENVLMLPLTSTPEHVGSGSASKNGGPVQTLQ